MPSAADGRGKAVADLEARGIEPLVVISRTQPHRPYGFRPPPKPKRERRTTERWQIAMQAKLRTDDAKALYAKRKQTVEPAFGIVKSAMGFVCFRLHGLPNAPPSGPWSRSPTTAAAYTECRRPAAARAGAVGGVGRHFDLAGVRAGEQRLVSRRRTIGSAELEWRGQAGHRRRQQKGKQRRGAAAVPMLF